MKITIARNGNSQDGFEHRLAFDFAGNEFVWRGNDSAALESIWDRATGEFTIRDVSPADLARAPILFLAAFQDQLGMPR